MILVDELAVGHHRLPATAATRTRRVSEFAVVSFVRQPSSAAEQIVQLPAELSVRSCPTRAPVRPDTAICGKYARKTTGAAARARAIR